MSVKRKRDFINAWIIFYPGEDCPIYHSMRSTKKACINAFMRDGDTWKLLYKQGYRCKSVSIIWTT